MLSWTVEYKGQKERIALSINRLLGLGVVFREGKIIKKSFRIFRNNSVKFNLNDKAYNIQLTEENFKFSGVLTINDEAIFENEIENKEEVKAPWYSFIFALFTMVIPIVSIESITTWAIGIISALFIFKIPKLQDKTNIKKIMYSIGIILIAWILYYLKFLEMKSHGISGGFINW